MARYPVAFALWHERTFGEKALWYYKHDAVNNCSVEGHGTAPAFGVFLQSYLRGRVLDVGCGPQAKAVYLVGYPDAQISGIDPLESFGDPHSFEFAQGVAEELPWADGTFDVVITGTSLDHVLDVKRVLGEIARVLRGGGVYVAWEQVLTEQPLPDPFANEMIAFDQCHLYKLGTWFVALVERMGMALVAQHGMYYVFERV